jgi:hypothetical protein
MRNLPYHSRVPFAYFRTLRESPEDAGGYKVHSVRRIFYVSQIHELNTDPKTSAASCLA